MMKIDEMVRENNQLDGTIDDDVILLENESKVAEKTAKVGNSSRQTSLEHFGWVSTPSADKGGSSTTVPNNDQALAVNMDEEIDRSRGSGRSLRKNPAKSRTYVPETEPKKRAAPKKAKTQTFTVHTDVSVDCLTLQIQNNTDPNISNQTVQLETSPEKWANAKKKMKKNAQGDPNQMKIFDMFHIIKEKPDKSKVNKVNSKKSSVFDRGVVQPPARQTTGLSPQKPIFTNKALPLLNSNSSIAKITPPLKPKLYALFSPEAEAAVKHLITKVPALENYKVKYETLCDYELYYSRLSKERKMLYDGMHLVGGAMPKPSIIKTMLNDDDFDKNSNPRNSLDVIMQITHFVWSLKMACDVVPKSAVKGFKLHQSVQDIPNFDEFLNYYLQPPSSMNEENSGELIPEMPCRILHCLVDLIVRSRFKDMKLGGKSVAEVLENDKLIAFNFCRPILYRWGKEEARKVKRGLMDEESLGTIAVDTWKKYSEYYILGCADLLLTLESNSNVFSWCREKQLKLLYALFRIAAAQDSVRALFESVYDAAVELREHMSRINASLMKPITERQKYLMECCPNMNAQDALEVVAEMRTNEKKEQVELTLKIHHYDETLAYFRSPKVLGSDRYGSLYTVMPGASKNVFVQLSKTAMEYLSGNEYGHTMAKINLYPDGARHRLIYCVEKKSELMRKECNRRNYWSSEVELHSIKDAPALSEVLQKSFKLDNEHFCYSSQSEIEKLISSLNALGLEESILIRSLKKWLEEEWKEEMEVEAVAEAKTGTEEEITNDNGSEMQVDDLVKESKDLIYSVDEVVDVDDIKQRLFLLMDYLFETAYRSGLWRSSARSGALAIASAKKWKKEDESVTVRYVVDALAAYIEAVESSYLLDMAAFVQAKLPFVSSWLELIILVLLFRFHGLEVPEIRYSTRTTRRAAQAANAALSGVDEPKKISYKNIESKYDFLDDEFLISDYGASAKVGDDDFDYKDGSEEKTVSDDEGASRESEEEDDASSLAQKDEEDDEEFA